MGKNSGTDEIDEKFYSFRPSKALDFPCVTGVKIKHVQFKITL